MSTSIKELKDRLSHYIHEVENGQVVIITSHRKPVAKLVPISQEETPELSRKAFLADLGHLHEKLGKTRAKKSMRDTVIQQRDEERA
jgi:prevent-host-death family protein